MNGLVLLSSCWVLSVSLRYIAIRVPYPQYMTLCGVRAWTHTRDAPLDAGGHVLESQELNVPGALPTPRQR
jgi:hypothetical protein